MSSEAAHAYAREAAKFLSEIGVKEKLHIDFSRCMSAYSAKKAFDKVSLAKNTPHETSPDLEKAFQSEFIGRTHEELYSYLNKCWAEVQGTSTSYCDPCFAIVQSSGFGKTRLLRELAVHCHRNEAVRRVGWYRLVYANVRRGDELMDFPPSTRALAAHLFPVREWRYVDAVDLADRLVHLFLVVMHPDRQASIHDLLMDLFSGKDWRFTEVLKEQDTEALKAARSSSQQQRQVLVLALDEARALLPESSRQGVDWLRILRRAQEVANCTIWDLSTCSRDSGVFIIFADSNAKVATHVSSFPATLYQSVACYEPKFFPPFVLTHTMDVLHATTLGGGTTIADADAATTKLALYKAEVTEALRALPHSRASWRNLRKLGRPLWLKRDEQTQNNNRDSLVQFAAQKFLCGKLPESVASYRDETLNGVAALLCRVGIRPNSSTPLAGRLVADFMAVLSFVSHTQDQFISSYSSDPILTLGATHVWHCLDSRMLVERMLPQLRMLLNQEALDLGVVDVVVARIVLLLAMDACARLEGDATTTHDSGAGEFFSVWTLLTALQGSDPTLRVVDSSEESNSTVRKAGASPTREALKAVKSQWKNWFVSFTHFVQLENAPSEACLWALLGRRAAGIMPRGKSTVDLIIPICAAGAKSPTLDGESGCVSMIVVQVKDEERSNASFPRRSAQHLRPSEIFGQIKKSPADAKVKAEVNSVNVKEEQHVETESAQFMALRSDSVLPICMSLRSEAVERFYEEDRGEDQTSLVLCLEGLGPLSVQVPVSSPRSSESAGAEVGGSSSVRVDVLTPEVISQLQKLFPPSWCSMTTLVEQDLESREVKAWRDARGFGPFRFPREMLAASARIPSAEALLLNSENSESFPLIESQFGRKRPRSHGQDGAEEPIKVEPSAKATVPEEKTKKKRRKT